MSNLLNIHQLIENPVIRKKLSYFISKNTIHSISKRQSQPFYRTTQKFAQWMIEALWDSRSQEELEIWLVEPSEQ